MSRPIDWVNQPYRNRNFVQGQTRRLNWIRSLQNERKANPLFGIDLRAYANLPHIKNNKLLQWRGDGKAWTSTYMTYGWVGKRWQKAQIQRNTIASSRLR